VCIFRVLVLDLKEHMQGARARTPARKGSLPEAGRRQSTSRLVTGGK